MDIGSSNSDSELQEDLEAAGNNDIALSVSNELVESEEVDDLELVEKTSQDKPTSKHNIPSSLTVENLKRYEDETHPVDVEELMAKERPASTNYGNLDTNGTDSVKPYSKKKQHGNPSRFQDRLESDKSPAVPFITRGHKYTGEEYEAITIDVQTDESWLWQDFSLRLSVPEQQRSGKYAGQQFDVPGSPVFLPPSLDRKKPSVSLPLLRSKNVTSDVSTSDINESDEEKTKADNSHIQTNKGDVSTSISSTSAVLSGMSVTANEEEKEEEGSPVVEVDVTESEFEVDTNTSDDTSNTVSSVLPPFILQYKAESKENVIDYDEIEETLPHDLKWEDLTETQREYYEIIVQEMKTKREAEGMKYSNSQKQSLLDIGPHDSFGSTQERKAAKEKAAERLKARELEKKKESVAAAAAANNQANFYSFARQLKTVNYSLSSEKCIDDGWTILPITPAAPIARAQEFFVQDSESDVLSARRYHETFVEKFYDNGRIFLSVFPDGTGTIWYSSGNVAMSIVASETKGKLIYIIQEDKDSDENPSIQAVFEPDGNCTCYYPNGIVRTNLTPFGGEYYSSIGERLKRWKWKDKDTHVHAPPFQPITLGLNKNFGVRILSQESIHVTFADGRRSVRLNVGTRLVLQRPIPKEDPIDMDTFLLQDRIAYTQSLIEKIHNTFKFPHSPRRNQIKLPHYLNTKLQRAAAQRAKLEEKLPPVVENVKRKSQSLVPQVSARPKLPQIPQNVKKIKSSGRVQGKVQNSNHSNELMFSVTVN